MELLYLLGGLLVLCLFLYLFWLIISAMNFPPLWKNIIVIVVAIILLLALINYAPSLPHGRLLR